MVTSEREPIMSMVQLSRDRLRRNTRYVDMIAQSMMFVGGDDGEYDCGAMSTMPTEMKEEGID